MHDKLHDNQTLVQAFTSATIWKNYVDVDVDVDVNDDVEDVDVDVDVNVFSG